MKRAIAHILASVIALGVLVSQMTSFKSVYVFLWYAPNIIATLSVITLLLLNLRYTPLRGDESLVVFCAAVVSTNFSVFISSFGGFIPMYRLAPLTGLQVAGSLVYMLSAPFYLWATFSLGRGLTILPEAHTLRVSGVYKISRHPIYLTHIIWCIAQNLIFQTWAVLILSLPQVALYLYRARREERVMSETFPEYLDYMKRVMWLGAYSPSRLIVVE